MVRRRSVLAAVLACVTLCAVAQDSRDFSIVLLPDTQFYSESYPDIFTRQTAWIRDNVTGQNIRFVIGLGDIVNQGSLDWEWQNAHTAYHQLDGVVPYFAAIGNNDYQNNRPKDRSATNFNRYFGPARYAGYSWYKGNLNGSNENFYGLVNVDGQPYLIMVLEFSPRDAALDWASNVIAANPTARVIITTHGYLFTDSTRLGKCDPYDAGNYGLSNDNDADEMWRKLVRRFPNIWMVVSGHIGGVGTGYRRDVGENGNLVHQLLTDYQTQNRGGDGYLRILKVHPASNSVDVVTYSPYINQYKTDPANQWTMPLMAKIDPNAGQGNVTGRVRDANSCAAVSGVNVAWTNGWSATNSYGSYTLSAVNAGLRSFTAYRDGWSQAYLDETVGNGMQSALDLFITPTNTTRSSTGTLAGRVISAVDGHAIAGASVQTANASTVSDSGGNYRLTVPAGNQTLSASASGWLPRSWPASVTAGGTTTMDLAISTAGIVRGTVRAATGSPMAGATVALSGGVIATNLSLKTDGAGVFSSNWIPVGTYKVTVSGQSRTSQVYTGKVTTLDFTLAP